MTQSKMSYEDLFNLARKLALALANEVAFSGEEAGCISLALLAQARKQLGLESAFDEIDSLRGDRKLVDNNEKGGTCTCTQLTALEPVINPDCPIHGPMQQPRV